MSSFEELLNKIDGRLDIHAKFINTFSFLEYIGARKILKSQADHQLTEPLLAHASEEIRHSLILKNLALKLSQGLLTTYQDVHLLCGSASKKYIQTVDHEIEKSLNSELNIKNVFLNYLLTTLLLEKRVVQIYPAYNKTLGTLGFPNKFVAIMSDEGKHLQSITQSLKEHPQSTGELVTSLLKMESGAFEEFMSAVQVSL